MKKKTKTVYVCSNCGAESMRWIGKCPACGEWNTYVEQQVSAAEGVAEALLFGDQKASVKLSEIDVKSQPRVRTGFAEVDLALGGGLVPGQVVLLAGEPGVGKSTLLLQLAGHLDASAIPVLYVAGEESPTQIASRAQRLFPDKPLNVTVFTTPEVSLIVDELKSKKPQFAIIDSIQTVFSQDVAGVPGGLSQVKYCTSELVRAAKSLGITLLIVGHINKSGLVAGPKVLEHLVDTVLTFSGEAEYQYRFIRVNKNRFGPTGEVALLEMIEEGLRDVGENGIFTLSDSAAIGVAKTVVFEGAKPFVVEIQVLVQDTVFPYPKRVAEGVPLNRVQLLAAVADKYLHLRLATKDIYVRTVGNFSLNSAQGDLAIVAALISSVQEKPVASDRAFVGEVNLSGRVSLPTARQKSLAKFKRLGISSISGPGMKDDIASLNSLIKAIS